MTDVTSYMKAFLNDELIYKSITPPGDSYYIRRCASEFARALNNSYETLSSFLYFRINQLSKQFELMIEDLETSPKYILPAITLFLNTVMDGLTDIKFAFDGPRNLLSIPFGRPALRKYLTNDAYADLILAALKKRGAKTIFLQMLQTEIVESKKTFLGSVKQRTGCFKEELMASAWHPQRLQKWLDAGYSLDEIIEF